jgi:hypothetical protein
MKIVQFDKSKAVTSIVNALKDKHEIINLSDVDSFNYKHFYDIKTCDFFLNNGTFGSKHPKRVWLPNSDNHKMAVMNHRNDLVKMFAEYYNKKIIHLESATLSRMKCNYINKFYKEIPPKYYRMGLNHWVYSKTKWCKSIKGRLENTVKLIEHSNKIKLTNVFNHQWKNNKDGYILILPGLEDDPTSSVPVEQFVTQSVETIRKHTDRRIVIKAHPHSKLTYKNPISSNVTIMTGSSRIVDFKNDIYCAVLDSSTSIFELTELGIPTVTTEHSFGVGLGNTDLRKIENLKYKNSKEVLEWYEEMASTEFLLSEFNNEKIILPRIMELLNE